MKKLTVIIMSLIVLIGCISPMTVYAKDYSVIDDICYIEPNNEVCIVSNADTPFWSYNIYKNKKWKIYKKNNNFEYVKVNKKQPILSDNITIKSVKVKSNKHTQKSKVTFTFKDLPTDAKFKVIISENTKFNNKTTKTFKKGTKSFTFKNIEVGKPYYVRIKVVKKDGHFTTKTKLFVIEGI